MPEETVSTTTETPKEITAFRTALTKTEGAATFLTVLDATLVQHERIASEGLTGYPTFEVAAKALLKEGIKGDEDYETAVRLANQAGSRIKKTEDRFEAAAGFFFKFHRTLTGLRGAANKPWEALRDKLSDAAGKWYLESKRAKEQAEAALSKEAEKDKLKLAEQAEALLDEGRVREAEAVLAQARVTVAPVLPEAVPAVENSRVTEGYDATCYDLTALGAAIFGVEQSVPLMWRAFNKDGSVKWERPLMTVDQVVLNEIVSRQGKSLNMPGVKVEDKVKIGALKL